MKNKKVVVIGGAGFIGSHLVDYLIEQENEVLVLDNLIAGRKDFINPKAKFFWCDITQSEHTLYKIFKGYDYVFNYAAEPYVPCSYERPLHVFDINARAALMVMNAAQEAGVKRIMQVSSAEIYGRCDGSITEEDHARPHSTYGAAKLAIDAIVQTRWKEALTPAIALRQFNCLGERDVLHPYVVPAIYLQAKKGNMIKLGNNTFRDFIYVGDAVRIAVELLERGQCGDVYNLGSEDGIQIYGLAQMIGRLLGWQELFIEVDPARVRKWEIYHLKSDNSKIYDVVEARPGVSLEEAVKRTIQYYEENPDKWSF